MQSKEIDKLAEALSKAQGAMKGAGKDALNPFFKSKYADLASCWDSVREPLSVNGLSVVQGTESGEHGLVVTSTLMHKSGQWMLSELPIKPNKPGLQELGKEISYARRYLLMAQVGGYQVDLDADENQEGNGKIQTTKEKKELSRPIQPKDQDDIPMGNVPPIKHDKFITPAEATEIRKKCSELKIPPKVAKSMIKELGIATVDETPADRKQEVLDALGFLHSEMAGTEVAS